MAENATATFAATGSSTFQYTITLHNIGTVAIGSFWFAWDDQPDRNFMVSNPTAIGSPAGWLSIVTHHPGSSTDGFGIEWIATDTSKVIAPGASSSAFTFSSTDTPTAMAGKSVFYPADDVTSSIVYQGLPLSSAGLTFSVTPACFRSGTRIRTARGDVAVEALRVGDEVETVHRGHQPVRWIGHRTIDCADWPDPRLVWPVRVAADAFGPGLPARPLDLSPDHAVYVDDVLVPVRCLIDGDAVRQQPVTTVAYYHVELDSHEILLAEGMPVETYLECGGRARFDAGTAPLADRPDIAEAVRESIGRAPLVLAGPRLAAIRGRLPRRAA